MSWDYYLNYLTIGKFIFCSSFDSKNPMDLCFVEDILKVMDDNNALVKSFRMVRDYIQSNESVNISLRLFRNRDHDPQTYNMPQVDEVATL
jgi:hypothetical protein